MKEKLVNKLIDYCTNGKDTIEGWFGRVDSVIFYEILACQNENSIDGSAMVEAYERLYNDVTAKLLAMPGSASQRIPLW
jgi:hypothetical protein